MKQLFIYSTAIIITGLVTVLLIENQKLFSINLPELAISEEYTPSVNNRYIDWTSIGEGIEYKKIVSSSSIEYPYTLHIVKISMNLYNLDLDVNSDNPHQVADWHTQKQSIATINAGYFNELYKSTGGLRVDDYTEGVLTYSGQNGYTGMIIGANGGVDLRYLPHTPFTEDERVDYFLQSFPTLLLPTGESGIKEESGKRASRSVIGQDSSNNIYFIQSDTSQISLYELSNILKSSELNLKIAINLDGGPSSGLAVSTETFSLIKDSLSLVPSVFVITKK